MGSANNILGWIGSGPWGSVGPHILAPPGLVGSVHEIGCLNILGNLFDNFEVDELETLGFSSLSPET